MPGTQTQPTTQDQQSCRSWSRTSSHHCTKLARSLKAIKLALTSTGRCSLCHSSRELLFVTDKDHYRIHSQSKCIDHGFSFQWIHLQNTLSPKGQGKLGKRRWTDCMSHKRRSGSLLRGYVSSHSEAKSTKRHQHDCPNKGQSEWGKAHKASTLHEE